MVLNNKNQGLGYKYKIKDGRSAKVQQSEVNRCGGSLKLHHTVSLTIMRPRAACTVYITAGEVPGAEIKDRRQAVHNIWRIVRPSEVDKQFGLYSEIRHIEYSKLWRS